MAFPWHRTSIKRARKLKTLGASSKRVRENKGTTIAVPLSGPIPAMKYGRAISADKIKS
jgi:hypothetical protein